MRDGGYMTDLSCASGSDRQERVRGESHARVHGAGRTRTIIRDLRSYTIARSTTDRYGAVWPDKSEVPEAWLCQVPQPRPVTHTTHTP